MSTAATTDFRVSGMEVRFAHSVRPVGPFE